ncbi:hypothetical protein [Microtetraspora sp. NBRC 16547]|uniref:hypothetical protein n=1 Tax=Microtetraspora sp. NBRC 16547 TaxID=3030993 RepID=UPI002552A693|nr:hypothetical protein [Microtetraspora sp. NBRC 16547]
MIFRYFRKRMDPAVHDAGRGDPAPPTGDPTADRLWRTLARRDLRSAREVLEEVSDPDDLAFYLYVCSLVPGMRKWAGEWIKMQPDWAVPLLVKGLCGMRWALQAAEPSGGGFRYFRRLEAAEDCFTAVLTRDPDNSAAWSYLVGTSFRRELPLAETRRRFAEVVARHPLHLHAHDEMLRGLSARWGGNEEEMFDFARATVATSPPGSPLGRLVASAHLERWFWEGMPDGYLNRPDVLAELHAAADRSVRHPAYRRRPGWPITDNLFAYVFVMAGDYTAARELFGMIGDLVTGYPWYRHGDPIAVFDQMRALAREHV